MPGLLSRARTHRNELLAFERIKKLVQKDRMRERRSQVPGTRLAPLTPHELESVALRERELNDMVTRHLEAARVRAEAGRRPTRVQKRAKRWLLHNQWVARQSAPRTAWAEEEDVEVEEGEEGEYELAPGETEAERNRMREDRQATAADRVEAERRGYYKNPPPYESPSATIPAPKYKPPKTWQRALKSKMTKKLFGRRTKSLSPTPGYTPGLPPDYEVGGSRRSRRRKTRKLRRK